MKQITQKLKKGKINITEVPVPKMKKGEILVRSIYSCVSAGTESSTVKAARKGYIGKAKERPEQVKQVIDTLKTQGPVRTYRAVMKKLDAHSPLGYSCVGQVIDLAPDVNEFLLGDYVACGGGSASHAEIVSVPQNLCTRLAPDTDLKQAAYNTLGAIAMQGIRQADLRLGESCAVIGLGLLGQLTCVLLKAAGVKVVGIDIDSRKVASVNAGETYIGDDNGISADGTGIIDGLVPWSGITRFGKSINSDKHLHAVIMSVCRVLREVPPG